MNVSAILQVLFCGIDEINNRYDNNIEIAGIISSINIRHNCAFCDISDLDSHDTLKCIIFDTSISKNINNSTIVTVSGAFQYYKTNDVKFRVDDIVDVRGRIKSEKDQNYERCVQCGYFKKPKTQIKLGMGSDIGLITSLGGVVKDDILRGLDDVGINIKLYDTTVQGASAITDLCCAIDACHKDKMDIIIIARGGGSEYDLKSFDSHRLVKKIYEATIPVIVAIGHTTDEPLVNKIADKSFNTPTEVRHYILTEWDNIIQKIENKLNRVIDYFSSLIKMELSTLRTKMEKYIENNSSYEHHFLKNKDVDDEVIIESGNKKYTLRVIGVKNRVTDKENTDKIELYTRILDGEFDKNLTWDADNTHTKYIHLSKLYDILKTGQKPSKSIRISDDLIDDIFDMNVDELYDIDVMEEVLYLIYDMNKELNNINKSQIYIEF